MRAGWYGWISEAKMVESVKIRCAYKEPDDVQTPLVVDCAGANTLVNRQICQQQPCPFLGGQTAHHRHRKENTKHPHLPNGFLSLRLHLHFHLPQPDDQMAHTLALHPTLYAIAADMISHDLAVA
ncbi:hypothetical protein FIBSPDRAFT_967527 [Athelia psychrophila]|uniref:Uncharacterized protein n=1 Tax=Athelia psychrophila TaxID=1759441 RepID=A0A167VM20_9AGAM|nr:hypothetical protein FIBSPDRAFT_967527 [Fibularhizoctonia sp. CBS 109695]